MRKNRFNRLIKNLWTGGHKAHLDGVSNRTRTKFEQFSRVLELLEGVELDRVFMTFSKIQIDEICALSGVTKGEFRELINFLQNVGDEQYLTQKLKSALLEVVEPIVGNVISRSEKFALECGHEYLSFGHLVITSLSIERTLLWRALQDLGGDTDLEPHFFELEPRSLPARSGVDLELTNQLSHFLELLTCLSSISELDFWCGAIDNFESETVFMLRNVTQSREALKRKLRFVAKRREDIT